MHCDRAQALMDRYVNEGFPPDERESFKIHLRGCPDCQQQLANLQKLLAVLQSVPSPPVPQGFVDRVMARAQCEVQACNPPPGPNLPFEDGGGIWERPALPMPLAPLLRGFCSGSCWVSRLGGTPRAPTGPTERRRALMPRRPTPSITFPVPLAAPLRRPIWP